MESLYRHYVSYGLEKQRRILLVKAGQGRESNIKCLLVYYEGHMGASQHGCRVLYVCNTNTSH